MTNARFYTCYTRAAQKIANIHTTHKGFNNNMDGARAIGTVAFPFMCGVNVGDLLCGMSIASIESIESIKCKESIETL